MLLQVLDDGRLTDGQGRTVNFKNTVIIMTSNIGSQLILEMRGADERSYQRMREQVLEALRRQFRPEFLNRVDEVVVFRALTEAELARIVEIQLEGCAGGWPSGGSPSRSPRRPGPTWRASATTPSSAPGRSSAPSSGRSRRRWRGSSSRAR